MSNKGEDRIARAATSPRHSFPRWPWIAHVLVLVVAVLAALFSAGETAWVLWAALLQAVLTYDVSVFARNAARRRQKFDMAIFWFCTGLGVIGTALTLGIGVGRILGGGL